MLPIKPMLERLKLVDRLYYRFAVLRGKEDAGCLAGRLIDYFKRAATFEGDHWQSIGLRLDRGDPEILVPCEEKRTRPAKMRFQRVRVDTSGKFDGWPGHCL